MIAFLLSLYLRVPTFALRFLGSLSTPTRAFCGTPTKCPPAGLQVNSIIISAEHNRENLYRLTTLFVSAFHIAPRGLVGSTGESPCNIAVSSHQALPTTYSSGDDVLALPKLNLQFLTFYDYLLRSFTLFRLESAYEIRGDLVDAVKRGEY